MKEVPIWEKTNLTLEEAAAYCGIGVNRLRKISDSDKTEKTGAFVRCEIIREPFYDRFTTKQRIQYSKTTLL